MRDLLRTSNLDLFREIKRLEALFLAAEARLPGELVPYYEWALERCQAFVKATERNLKLLDFPTHSILNTVLSWTQAIRREFDFFDQDMVRPILRADTGDRLCLKLLVWLHDVHAQTKGRPAAFTDGQVAIYASERNPVLYLMPSTMQRGLLYLPLCFHEFGHELYLIHKQEMDDLVRVLQERIRLHLEPALKRGDPRAQTEAQRRTEIVERWYDWAQEFFCDAVGLVIGGPAYLYAFSMYMRVRGRSAFSLPAEELRFSSHPVPWARIRLLCLRARTLGMERAADELERSWNMIADLLDIREDYYGYFEEGYIPDLVQTLDYMLEESAPYSYGTLKKVSVQDSTQHQEPVAMLNEAWQVFFARPDEYADWEEKIIREYLS